MENLHEHSSAFPCNDSNTSTDTDTTTTTASIDISKRNPAAKFRLLRSRASRAGFSTSRSFHGLEQFKIQPKVEEDEEEEEEANEEAEIQAKAKGETTDVERVEIVDDDCIRSLESEIDSSRASTSCEETQDNGSNLKNSPQWRGFFKLLRKRSNKTTMHWQGFHPLNVPIPKLTRRKSKRISDDMVPSLDVELCYFKSSWKNFTLSELEKATNKFSHDNLIGEGGSSEVYKGQMEDGNFVAIKRLTGGTPEEITSDFLSELGIIVHVNHHNIAKLIGYGVEGGMHLVLQLSPHGSLASLLNGSKEDLNWDVRYKIALGTAKGLLYLHEACQRRIIHKDIKAANILLTEDFEAQISDFGLAKWLPDKWTHHVISKFEGTFGYLPPEFFMHGIVDEKTDVYAYGVLLLEIITGRLALDNSQKSLLMWAKPLMANNRVSDLVDPSLGNSYNSQQMELLVFMASLCVDQSSNKRPQMRQVVKILSEEEGSIELIKHLRNHVEDELDFSDELPNADECNSTTYLTDMNRQMQIVLDL